MKALLDTNLLVAEALSHRHYDIAVSSLSWAELGFRNSEDFRGLEGVVTVIAA